MLKENTKSIYDTTKRGNPAWEELNEVLKYRHLLVQLVRRDILTRYKRSVLGVAWTMLNPLGIMIILTIVFSQVFARGTPSYPAFVLSGLMAWNFFSQTTNAATVQLVWGGNLLKRIYVPKTIFALSATGTGLVNLVLSLVPLLLVMVVTGVPIRWTIIFLPIPVFFLILFTLGVGLFVSAIAIYFADVADMYKIVLTAWIYLSPVIYSPDILPEAYRVWIIRLNPMYHLINFFRMPIYDGVIPSLQTILLNGVIAGITFLIGWFLFTWRSDEFAYRV